MIAIIFGFLPIILIPIGILLTRRRESLTWEIRKGKICYNCKQDTNISDDLMFKRLLDQTDYSKLCVSCVRDMKITSIRNPLILIKHKFLKYMITKNFDKLSIYFGVIIFILITIDVIFMMNGIRLRLFWIYSSINLLLWSLIFYKIIYTTKKPSE